MARYAINGGRTFSANTTVIGMSAHSTSPRRGKLYDLLVGSDASPADATFVWEVLRSTTAGTSSAVTPEPLDPADAAASMSAGKNHSAEPTTGNLALNAALNQRSFFRWVAAPGSEIVWPATANNGLAIRTKSGPASTTILAAALVEEQ